MLIDLVDLDDIETFLSEGKHVILDFYADWCPPCKKFLSTFRLASDTFSNLEKCFVKVNVDAFPDLAGKYKITSIPSLVFLKQDKDHHKIVGLLDIDAFQQAIDEYFS